MNNKIDLYLGQMYDFSGGGADYLLYEKLPDNPNIQWEEMKRFKESKVKLIDVWAMSEDERILNYYYIEFPTGERGLLYFWIGD